MTPAPPVDLAPAGADPKKAPPGKMNVTLGPAPDRALSQPAGNVIGGGNQVAGGAGTMASQTFDNTCTAQLDMSKVTVVADPTATLHAIMRNQIVAPVSRTVAVKLVAATLTGPTPAGAPKPAPSDTVMAVQVVFENGQTATFDASQTADRPASSIRK